MSSAKNTPSKKQAVKEGLIRLDKIDQEIVQRDAGAYYLLIEAIMPNKRLVWEIVDRYLEEHGMYLMPKAEADAEMNRKYPQFRKTSEKASKEVAAARAEIRKRERRLMDLVR